MILWGLKEEASFDVWSIEHIIMGISIACFTDWMSKKLCKDENVSENLRIKISFIMALMFSYMWETLEHYLEVGLWGNAVSYWLQGVEHWSNRLICDNLMVMLGWWIYQQKNKIVWFARCFSVVWLFVHIFIFPHSMYLHELFK
ncbi:MAG: hypothetical protein IJW75_01110 [Alphaproteobacteria bacterium]|nr:hypothetical protein [Alphaproteobacteria bacterium]